jgi:hypothetical protein
MPKASVFAARTNKAASLSKGSRLNGQIIAYSLTLRSWLVLPSVFAAKNPE